MSNMGRTGGWIVAFAVFLAAPAVACAQTADRVSDAEAGAAAATITEADLRTHLAVLAHDSMRGRATPSPELRETAEYVAAQFASSGLRPGAEDGSWLQEYPLTTLRAGPAADHLVRIAGPAGTWDLDFETDYLVQYESEAAEGAGGVVRYEVGGEPVDVTGRIVAVRVTTANLQQVFGGGLGTMLEGDPAGVLLSLDVAEDFLGRLRRFLGGGRTKLGEPAETSIPVVYTIHSRLPAPVQALFAGTASAEGWSAELATRAVVETETAPNTIGILDGSDPELADEYVIFTAHMDHVGVNPEAGADSIFNGADDDASGTVTIVELAQAFASLDAPPRRSLVFMTVSGEERGLLGSRWFSDNPTIPLEAAVANLNMDMVGRNWTDTIVAIGKEESSLGALVESIAADHPELDMAVIDDLWPEESFYTRSDHFNFARKGVPILFFFNGVHEDYHQPSDEIEKIDFEKMARIGRLVFYTGLAAAEADDPPIWDADAYARVVEDGPEEDETSR